MESSNMIQTNNETQTKPVPSTVQADKASLHGFCKANSLPKTSVSRKAKELGISTSNGLTSEDCEILLLAFNVQKAVPATSQEILEPELVEESTAIAVVNPLDSYSPLTASQAHIWQHTDTSALVAAGKSALDDLLLQTANNQNLGIAALIENERNEGAKLGIALAQVKLGTATQVKDEVISDYLKKQGLSVG